MNDLEQTALAFGLIKEAAVLDKLAAEGDPSYWDRAAIWAADPANEDMIHAGVGMVGGGLAGGLIGGLAGRPGTGLLAGAAIGGLGGYYGSDLKDMVGNFMNNRAAKSWDAQADMPSGSVNPADPVIPQPPLGTGVTQGVDITADRDISLFGDQNTTTTRPNFGEGNAIGMNGMEYDWGLNSGEVLGAAAERANR